MGHGQGRGGSRCRRAQGRATSRSGRGGQDESGWYDFRLIRPGPVACPCSLAHLAKAASGADPLASSSAPPPKAKLAASLAFSSSTGSKRKVADGDTAAEWDAVVKRSRVDVEAKGVADEARKVDAAKDKEKALKQKKKEEAAQKKKVGLLSFADE